MVPTLVARAPFPIPADCEASLLHGLAEDSWADQRPRWEQLLRNKDVEGLWKELAQDTMVEKRS